MPWLLFQFGIALVLLTLGFIILRRTLRLRRRLKWLRYSDRIQQANSQVQATHTAEQGSTEPYQLEEEYEPDIGLWISGPEESGAASAPTASDSSEPGKPAAPNDARTPGRASSLT
ncbi:MAG: hypothetical protein KF699_11805 [Phycisphaeraceae bacterium]|nr:hypothetical protein [Phycisphaeraceae bacterium]MBX3407220.1 hypothetical protein [Phycisphaeraceae bacterium]